MEVTKEDYLQYKLCDWLREKKIMHFHVPNGGLRSKREGAKFKAMGVKAGVHDLIILLDKGRTIFIELKVGNNKLQPSQVKFDLWLKKAGHPSHLVHANNVESGIEQLLAILQNYAPLYGHTCPLSSLE